LGVEPTSTSNTSTPVLGSKPLATYRVCAESGTRGPAERSHEAVLCCRSFKSRTIAASLRVIILFVVWCCFGQCRGRRRRRCRRRFFGLGVCVGVGVGVCVRVCVFVGVVVALLLPCWPAALPNRSFCSIQNLLAACKTAFVARRHLFRVQRSYCQMPPAPRVIDVSETQCIDRRFTVSFPPPPLSPPPHSAPCSPKCALVSPLPLRGLFWLCALVFVPTRTPAMHSLAFRAGPCTSALRQRAANAGWRAITRTHPALCALVSPCCCAATLPRLGAVTPSSNASLAFRVWPRTKRRSERNHSHKVQAGTVCVMNVWNAAWPVRRSRSHKA
jgi:hypothetical protein